MMYVRQRTEMRELEGENSRSALAAAQLSGATAKMARSALKPYRTYWHIKLADTDKIVSIPAGFLPKRSAVARHAVGAAQFASKGILFFDGGRRVLENNFNSGVLFRMPEAAAAVSIASDSYPSF